MGYLLEMKGISKTFPGIKANDGINLQIRNGEIHALVGENGAGKSTLMNILFGLYSPDEGEVFYQGGKSDIKSPRDAIDKGIGMVHQHFMLVPPLSVAENMVLGVEPRQGIYFDKKTAEKKVEELAKKYGLSIDPKVKIRDLSVGRQQRVEILKTLYRGADLIILDEPTAVLTPQEVQEFFVTLRSLTASGKTIIFITHKLKEVMAVSDRVTVLRRGKSVGTVNTAETSEEDLAEMMVGRKVLLSVEKEDKECGEKVFEVRDLHGMNSRGQEAVKGVSFFLRRGEILGIAGVAGNGQSELVEMISGLRKPSSGGIFLKGKDVTSRTNRQRRRSGLGHIPEDRHHRGLVLDFSVAENLVLGDHYIEPVARGIKIFYDRIYEKSDRLVETFDIRGAGRKTKARSLSGGNQQKVIIAREIDFNPDFMVAAQPTRGVDIGAIEFIHKRLISERDEGKGILLVSSELQEIFSLSDRILVMFEGRVVGEVNPKEVTEEEIGLMMAGAGREAAE